MGGSIGADELLNSPIESGVFPLCLPRKSTQVQRAEEARPGRARQVLLNFGFCIGNMLADNGIKLLDLHFVWHVLLILSRGVKVARSCRGHQLDFISHDSLPAQPHSRLLFIVDELDSLPLLAQIRNHLLNPQLIDQAHALG